MARGPAGRRGGRGAVAGVAGCAGHCPPTCCAPPPGGYRLDLPTDAVDALRFDRLAREAGAALTAGDPAAARRLATEALALWRGPALVDAAGAPFTVGYVAGLDETRKLADLAAESTEEHPVLALLEPMLGLFLDDGERALAAVDRRLDVPDPWTRAVLWMVRGAVREDEGDLRGARDDISTAVAGLREVGDRFAPAQALTGEAEAHLAFGEPEQATAALEESIELLAELDPDDDVAHERILLATARVQLGDVERARADCLALTKPTARPRSARGVAFARLVLGDLARYEDDLAEAIGAAIGHAMSAKDMPVGARIAVAEAAAHARFGNPTDAARALGAAEQLRGAPDARNPEVARLADRLRADVGDAAFDLGRADAIAVVRAAV